MNLKIHLLGFALLLFILIAGCKQQPQTPSNRIPPDREAEDLMLLNKAIVEAEDAKIVQYINKQTIRFQKDSLGFWYSIQSHGSGLPPKKNDKVDYYYSVALLNGARCYSTFDTKQINTVFLGKGVLFSGFEMAIKKLASGGEGIFVIPSYLAYSVAGDGRKIPPYSTLVCRIKVISISKNTTF